jgi:hypothetical protein
VFIMSYELNLYVMQKKIERLCGLVVKVSGYRGTWLQVRYVIYGRRE